MTAPRSTRSPATSAGVGGAPSSRPASMTAGEAAPGRSDAPTSEVQATPPAPEGLKASGQQLWQDVTSAYALRVDELALLGQMCHTVDDIDAMREALAADGIVVGGSRGQRRPNPMLTELRGSRLLLLRLAAQLGLPDEDEPAGATPASRKAARAANIRWQREAVSSGEA